MEQESESDDKKNGNGFSRTFIPLDLSWTVSRGPHRKAAHVVHNDIDVPGKGNDGVIPFSFSYLSFPWLFKTF